jgi:hypothetical protein
LIEKTGAIDVYFEDEIQVLVEEPELFSLSTLKETLTELEVEFTEISGSGTF